jgi:hypothetical protein
MILDEDILKGIKIFVLFREIIETAIIKTLQISLVLHKVYSYTVQIVPM